jgi:putative transposase
VLLVVIIDLKSRLIGWQLAEHMMIEQVCQVIENARCHRGCLPKPFHSDRGSQYASEEFGNVFPSVAISMSRKGTC